jgi:hypothetical protein
VSPTRRSLITGLVALVAAPAIVRAQSLMPVRVMTPIPDFHVLHIRNAVIREGLFQQGEFVWIAGLDIQSDDPRWRPIAELTQAA